MWVGGVADSQTRFKPLKTPPNHPENRLFRPKFHLSFSQILQKPWGGWVGKQIWERFPKIKLIFLYLPLIILGIIVGVGILILVDFQILYMYVPDSLVPQDVSANANSL